MSDITGTALAQALDQAVAAYQRHFGRPRTIEKLKHMVARAEEAQRISDDATARLGDPARRAAE